MALELRLQVKLQQQLVMTPQLQQAIKLLQLNRLELATVVEQELQENPVLEEVLDGDEEPTPTELSDATPGQDPEMDSPPAEGESAEVDPSAADLASVDAPEGEAPSDAAPEAGAEAEPGTEPEASDLEKITDTAWEDYMDAYPQTGLEGRAGGEDERPAFDATLTKRPSLSDHLSWQIHLSNFSPEEEEAARWIVGNLDDHGLLRSTVEEVARQSGCPETVVEQALAKVQTLDPTGVAARDLRECLLLQLDALDIDDPLVVAIVRDHMDLLRKRDFRGLARALGVAIEEIATAAKVIGSLEPRPGRAFGGDEAVYVTPDIYVYKVDEEFHVVLNEDGLPKLKINKLYRQLSKGPDVGRDTREYVQDKVRAAVWLIKSIHQRQRTIYKVMRSIITHQRDFFERGVQFLKPLNLRDVADDIEMHESTVSRVTSNKYVHCPQGIFELKFFFNSSIGRFEGEAIASESVKEKIRKIITNEDARRPLSDQRIAEMLKAANIDIARRTVTKYREAMNILSSTKRRQIG